MSRCLALVAVLGGGASVSFAVDSVKPEAGSISGSVSDAINAQPLSNASLTQTPVRRYVGEELTTSLAATSDQNRLFEFENIAAGDYFLTARKAGFVDRTFGSRIRLSNGTPISVHAGDTVKGIVVTMLRGAVISGTVVNEDGEAFANVTVRALQYKFSPGGKRLAIVSSTVANDRGEYRLHGLLPGSDYVSCSTSRSRSIKEGGVTVTGRYPVTFYPSVTSVDKAAPMLVQAGNEVVLNFAMAATRAFTIRGKIAVSDPGHKPALAFSPVVGSDEQPLNVIVDDNNKFVIKA
jgi:CBS domain-containing protein